MGSFILTNTALEVCGGVDMLRRSETRWPYEVVVAGHRSPRHPPERVARMEKLSPEDVLTYPDGSIQFCAVRFCAPMTEAGDQLLQAVPWGNRSATDPLVGQAYHLYCSSKAIQRVYGEDCLVAGGESPVVADPAALGISVVFRRRSPTDAAVSALAKALLIWQAGVAAAGQSPAATADFLDDRLSLWGNVAHFRLRLYDANPNVILWLLICLLNHSLNGGRAVAIDFFRYNISQEEARVKDHASGNETRFDLATIRMDKDFSSKWKQTGARRRNGSNSKGLALHPHLQSAQFPVLVDGPLGENNIRVTICFEEWPVASQREHLSELINSWQIVNVNHGFETGAIKYWSELQFSRDDMSATIGFDPGESTNRSFQALLHILDSFDRETGLIQTLVWSGSRTR